MSDHFEFDCPYCGKDFGNAVIDLAKHIGEIHDSPRS